MKDKNKIDIQNFLDDGEEVLHVFRHHKIKKIYTYLWTLFIIGAGISSLFEKESMLFECWCLAMGIYIYRTDKMKHNLMVITNKRVIETKGFFEKNIVMNSISLDKVVDFTCWKKQSFFGKFEFEYYSFISEKGRILFEKVETKNNEERQQIRSLFKNLKTDFTSKKLFY